MTGKRASSADKAVKADKAVAAPKETEAAKPSVEKRLALLESVLEEAGGWIGNLYQRRKRGG